jgi:hypothetical protein
MNGRHQDSPSATALDPRPDPDPDHDRDRDPAVEDHAGPPPAAPGGSPELHRALAEVKGQAQFLLYLADQIEESLQQFAEDDSDASHAAFLCKILSMYSGQLEVKYQSLGERVAETCQEVYLTVRERDAG